MAKVGVLVGPMFEDVEYTDPVNGLKEAGHEIVNISSKDGSVEGKHGTKVDIDITVNDTTVNDYDALFLPGGFSPDQLRADENVVEFVRNFADSNKLLFAICHGPQLLISADRVEGKKMTAWKTVQTDLKMMGVDVEDKPVVEDGNLITSRQPDDIPKFTEYMSRRMGQT